MAAIKTSARGPVNALTRADETYGLVFPLWGYRFVFSSKLVTWSISVSTHGGFSRIGSFVFTETHYGYGDSIAQKPLRSG